MSGGGGGTQTTTQKTDLPAWAQDAQQSLQGHGASMAENFLRNPNYGIVATNPDQEMGYDLSRQTALNTFNTPGLTAVGSGAGQMQAAQVGAGDAQQFMNPYIQNVVDPTVNSMRRDYATSAADAAARSASASGFGGSRGAIERSNLDRNFADQSAKMVAQLMSQGWTQAQAIAQANAQMRQQAGQQNAQGSLQAIQQDNANLNDRQRREMLATAQLTGYGDAQQKWQQSAQDVPWTMLSRLLGVTPSLGNVGGTVTKTEPDNSPGMGQQALGAGVSILGKVLPAMIGASDERAKTDIQDYGKTPDGTKLYAYRYKGDPKTYPKVVGPMAQDLEKKNPGSTVKMPGSNLLAVLGMGR